MRSPRCSASCGARRRRSRPMRWRRRPTSSRGRRGCGTGSTASWPRRCNARSPTHAPHLDRLVGPRFVVTAGTRRLPDVHRYVRGIDYRVERLADDVARDLRRIAEVVPLEQQYTSLRLRRSPARDIRWKLEELRVSLFAQAIGARGSVSAVRLARELGRIHPSV